MKAKWFKMSLVMVMLGVFTSSSLLAVNDKAINLSKQQLVKAHKSYMSSNLPNALHEVNLSNEYYASLEGLVFQIQLACTMGDIENAKTALNKLKVLLPNDICTNILSAMLLSVEHKDGHKILKHIKAALDRTSSKEEREEIITMVEQDDSFEYFRTACIQQYKSLERTMLKLESNLKAGVTKWEAKPLGPKLWLSDEACKNLSDGAYVANMILKFVPKPYKIILKTTLKISEIRIKNANKKHRGVIMSWTWINAGSATFFVKSQ
ncbi:MAG: hypothetical protein GY756_04260 [bacterium]|nr:hypothetical protein [bacterium]